MHVFPAEIPAAEARRVDVVEVRVARKVAPLFGLGDDLPPFRRSWVCDFTTLSLAEIGRGAPSPSRAERSRLEAAPPGGPGRGERPTWAWAGRAVWSPQQSTVPGALTNATLNRYGPDTKAAAVLAGANRLLHSSTAAVQAVCRHLAGSGCDAEVRLAVWAGLTLEVYRAQPALVVAAVQARQVQRSLSAQWGTQVDWAGGTEAGAPSEIRPSTTTANGGPSADESAMRCRPTSFHLVDSTLPALGLADDPAGGAGLVAVDTLDDIASAWCHRLLGIGRPGRGLVWLTEDGGGSRRVHAMLRVGAVVAPFVAATLGGTPAANRASPPVLPTLPKEAELAEGPQLLRRAHLLTAHVATNYVRYRDDLLLDWPELRSLTRQLVNAAVARAEVLDTDDPVSLQLRAYAAYLDVWDPLRDPKGAKIPAGDDGDAAVKRLAESQQQVIDAWRAGRLDPGATAYLLEIGVVALREAGGDPTVIAACWSAILESRGLAPAADLAARADTLSDAQVFHLHHYAAWLAHSGRRVDLRRALAVQKRVTAVRTEVTRRELAGFAAKSAAARAGHELAAEIATELASATPERERGARARALEAAVRYARAVLADPSTRLLLRPAGPHPTVLRTAQVVARALTTAASHAVAVDAADAIAAVALLDAAIGKPDNTRPERHGHQSGRGRPDKPLLDSLRSWRAQLADLADRAGRTPVG